MSIRDSGATVTPEIFTDSAGQEVMSYEMGEVRSGSTRMQQIEEFNETDDGYYFDEDGELQHSFADLDPEKVQQITEPDFIRPKDERDAEMNYELPTQDITELQNIAGSPEEYRVMMQWANNNAPPELIAHYDSVMDTGNYEEMSKCVTAMHNAYLGIRTDEDMVGGFDDEEDNDGPSIQDQIIDQDLAASNNFVIEQFGGKEAYAQAQAYAKEVLPPEVRQAFNNKMESTVDGNERVRLSRAMFDTLRGIMSGQQPPQR